MSRRNQQKLNISNIQDFVLNERNIEIILKNTISNTEVKSMKSKTKIQHKKVVKELFLTPRFIDTLFWCYYIIKNGLAAYEIIHGDGFQDSFEQKIQLVYDVRENKELLKKHKWKRRAIEDELVNYKKISITAFMCICAINNYNIVYINGRKIYTLMNNADIATNLNIIENTDKGYSIFIGTNEEKHKKYIQSIEQLWHIDNLMKPLRGISSYRVKKLQDICTKLQIDIYNEKKMPKKKSILYQMIQEYL